MTPPKGVLCFAGCAYSLFCAVFLILLVIGGVIFSAHSDQINNWDRARVTIGGDEGQFTDRSCADPGETNCKASICANATFEGDERIDPGIIKVKIRFPPPPEMLNLQNRSTVDAWLRDNIGVPGLDIFFDGDAGPDEDCEGDAAYHAITRAVPQTSWIIAITIYGFFVICVVTPFVIYLLGSS